MKLTMHLRPVLCLCLLLALAVPAAGSDRPDGWRAGVAKVVITPDRPLWMSGYGGRTKPAEGKVHDLWAKALALQAGGGRPCVLITMDLVGIDRDTAQAVCAELHRRHGLKRDEVRLAVSHTHCGPVVGTNLLTMYPLDEAQKTLIRAYTRDLKDKLVGVADAALRDVRPAELSWGNGLVTFATNRRNNKEADVPKLRDLGRLKGPVDHQVPVLAVRDPGGAVRAVVFGYACHATVLSFYEWCGDYPGFAQLALEERHPGAVALFWAGCGGDQNPLPRRTVALARRYGDRLADGVEAVLRAPMNPVPAGLRTSYAEIDLPFAELPTREALAKEALSDNHSLAGRARALLERLDRSGALPRTYPYPVQAWQLGPDLTWVALGGEAVVDYPLRLRKELGPVWVNAYANDVMAYIPSLRVLKEGGYEGATSMIPYGQPSTWGPRIEELIVGAVHTQVGKVRE